MVTCAQSTTDRTARASNQPWPPLAGYSCVAGGRVDLAPAAGPVVGDDLPEHRHERGLVDRLTLAKRDRARGLVVVAGSDDALRVRDDPTVVEEDVDVVLGREQRADVSVTHEVRLHPSLDRLLDRRIAGVDEVAHSVADLLLPRRQRV